VSFLGVQSTLSSLLYQLSSFSAPHFPLVKEALIEIGCRDVVGRWLVIGCHARALWPNGAS